MTPLLPPLLPRSVHGGPSSTAFDGADFSVNCNPYGPNPALLAAVREADYAHYPDPSYRDVRQSLADWHGVFPDQVAPSVGASDLLHRLARAFLAAGDVLLSLHAPFGELERAARLQRANTVVVCELPAALPPNTRLVYVGQPHNPTGYSLSGSELQAAAQACAGVGALLVLDLAYAPFLAYSPSLACPPSLACSPTLALSPSLHPAAGHPAVVSLLSPGKAHGLVGARPAYAVASAQVTARLDNLAPAWHLPSGTAALLSALPGAQEFLVKTLPRVREDAAALAHALREFGRVRHHGTPYLTLEVGNAAAVAQALLTRGVRVRDCASYGLPEHIRVSTQGAADERLVRTLAEVLRGGAADSNPSSQEHQQEHQ